MRELLEDLKFEYEEKFASYLKIAKMSEEAGDQDNYKGMLKKAAGCKLMIEEYERQLSSF